RRSGRAACPSARTSPRATMPSTNRPGRSTPRGITNCTRPPRKVPRWLVQGDREFLRAHTDSAANEVLRPRALQQPGHLGSEHRRRGGTRPGCLRPETEKLIPARAPPLVSGRGAAFFCLIQELRLWPVVSLRERLSPSSSC